jgi:hypothetical protein
MVKPDLFTHEELFSAEQIEKLPLRFAFIGLWTQCDRDGRFEWRPLRLKLAILPWDDVDLSAVLEALTKHVFIVRYEVDGKTFGAIPSWPKHQHPHPNEAASVIPPPPTVANGCTTVTNGCTTPTNGGTTQADSNSNSKSDSNSKSEADAPAKERRFVKPTIEEVRAYCLERKNKVDAEQWFSHYEANGWLVGKNPMKNWKAAVVSWERNDFSTNGRADKTRLWEGPAAFVALDNANGKE